MFEAYADVRGAALPVDLFGPAGRRPRGALRGDRACRVRTLSSGSALRSPLPCRDVNTHRTRWAKGRASDSSCLTVY